MVERLTQLAIDPGALVIRNIAPPEINQACLEVARKRRANDGLADLAMSLNWEITSGWRAEFHRARAGGSLPWARSPRRLRVPGNRCLGRTVGVCLVGPTFA